MAITCDQAPFLFRGGNEKKGRLIAGQNGQWLLSFQISPRCGVTGNFKTKPFSKSAEITSSKTRAVFVTVLVTLSESEMRQPEIWSRNRNSNLKLISFAYVYLTLSWFHGLFALKLVTVKNLVHDFIRLWIEMSPRQIRTKFICVTIFRTHVCPMKSFVITRYAKYFKNRLSAKRNSKTAMQMKQAEIKRFQFSAV